MWGEGVCAVVCMHVVECMRCVCCGVGVVICVAVVVVTCVC